jgi:hypothetical protein
MIPVLLVLNKQNFALTLFYQACCRGEICLTKSPSCQFEATSPHLREEGLSRFISSPNPTHVGASGSGCAPFFTSFFMLCLGYSNKLYKGILKFIQSFY